jgi:hypothetical protein
MAAVTELAPPAAAAHASSLWADTLREVLRQRSARAGLALLTLIILAAALADALAVHGPTETLFDVPGRSGCPARASTSWAVPMIAPSS